MKKIFESKGFKSFLSSLICIGIGLLFGLIVMIIMSLVTEDVSIGDAFTGLVKLILGPLASINHKNRLQNMGDTIFYAVPLIMTGLSVALAYKTGLFNIGAPGQFIMGTMGSLLIALSIKTTTPVGGFFVWLLAIIVGILFGMAWGAIPGMFKAFFNINEVIVCIMTNWIAGNLASWLFSNIPSFHWEGKGGFLQRVGNNHTPTLGLDKLFPNSYIDCGIIIVIIVAILVAFVLNKTTFGYELKACGYNRNASKYVGMDEKRNIILSMVIAGGLAGLGAALYYLNAGIEYNFVSQYLKLPSYGFNGIASAFLANCNPVGIVVSSLFIRWINMGGEYLTVVGLNRYIAEVVISVIIYMAGFSRLFGELLNKRKEEKKKKKEEAQASLDKEAQNG